MKPKHTVLSTQIRRAFYASLICASWAACGPAAATELIYYPTNPSFGGNPLNGPMLLNSAQAQNKHTDDPDLDRDQFGFQQETPLQTFNDTLQRSILSRVAASATSQIIGGDGMLRPGTIETGDFTISIIDAGGGVLNITTTDKSSGASTSFQVGQ